MAIVFKNGRWFDTELNKAVSSPFVSRNSAATPNALRPKNNDLADAYSQMSGMPFNNDYEISGYSNDYTMPMNDSRFTNYGNRFSQSLDSYMKGDFFQNLYNDKYGGKSGIGKYLNKENLNMLKTGTDIFGNIATGISAMRNANTAKEEMLSNRNLDKANFYNRVSDYNTKAGFLNEKLIADGRTPTYKPLSTTY